MNLKDIEQAVARIQSQLFRNANSVSVGQLKSHFKGSGLQFKEHQTYCHGDDVRFIDWKMLAKTDQVYIRTFEEERNVEIVIVIDASLSMTIGHKGISKLQAAIEIACLLYLLSEETDDIIEVVIVSDRIHSLPKMKGKRGMTFFVSLLEKIGILDSDGKVRLDYRPLRYPEEKEIESSISKYLAKRREVLLLTDFHQFISQSFIKRQSARPNLHCVNITSPLDESNSLPFSVFGIQTWKKGEYQKGLYTVRTKKEISLLKSALGRRFKNINVKGRYLEDFIKEMV